MTTQSYFSTLILKESLAATKGFEAWNNDLRDACEMVSEGDEAGQAWSEENGYFGYTSYASLGDLPKRAPAFNDLATRLTPIATGFAQEIGYDVNALELDSFWVNVLEPGGHHSGHIHPNSVISGTYYVDVPEGSGSIMFEDPRLSLLMNAPRQKPELCDDQKRFIYIQPTVGTVLMWESWLRHEVRPNLADAVRISISFNYSEA